MSTKADEVKLDIEELDKLLQQASRQKVKDVISVEIRKLQTDLKKLQEDEKSAPIKSSDATVNTTQKFYEVKLNNYGWDQTDTSVKLYVTLENVQQLPKESVVCNFTEKSLDLHVLGLDNKNYVLTINNLCEEIEPTKSCFKVKKDMVIVSVIKKEMKTWSHVTGIEKRIKTSKSSLPDMDDESDTGSKIMNLMKTMYHEGDDDVKRTIAKAWTESMQKTAPGLSDLQFCD
ncbi:calcyclin-binding protein [Megalopta genalis]|uniref:calcyclin-binding protein n=1 Tax=Megalopta genalis TaxID=115081 RepID=UPI001442F1A4|nr:calcyclin-binding protein [Megalopta genalis]